MTRADAGARAHTHNSRNAMRAHRALMHTFKCPCYFAPLNLQFQCLVCLKKRTVRLLPADKEEEKKTYCCRNGFIIDGEPSADDQSHCGFDPKAGSKRDPSHPVFVVPASRPSALITVSITKDIDMPPQDTYTGCSASAFVYKAKWKGTCVVPGLYKDSIVAVKQLRHEFRHAPVDSSLTKTNLSKLHRDFENEVRHLSSLSHPHIVPVYAVDSEEMALVQEFLPHCVGRLLEAKPSAWTKLELVDKVNLLKQVASALDHCHSSTPVIIHCDLKPQNILIDENLQCAKICDFGLARVMEGTSLPSVMSNIGTTQCYRAPELLNKTTKTSEKIDIYGFALVMYEVLTGMTVAMARLSEAEIERDGKRPSEGLDEMDSELCELVEECWAADPSKRPTAHSAHTRLDNYLQKSAKDVDYQEDVKTIRGLKEGSTTVFRVLYAHENPADGIVAKDPDAQIALEDHVRNGDKDTAWISTTLNLKWAFWHASKMFFLHGERRRIVEIDLSKTETMVHELITASGRRKAGLKEGRASANWALSASEVCVHKYIPQEAILKRDGTNNPKVYSLKEGGTVDKAIAGLGDNAFQCYVEKNKSNGQHTVQGPPFKTIKPFKEWIDQFNRWCSFGKNCRWDTLKKECLSGRHAEPDEGLRISELIKVSDRYKFGIYIGNAKAAMDKRRLEEKGIQAVVQARPNTQHASHKWLETKVVRLLDGGDARPGDYGAHEFFVAKRESDCKEVFEWIDMHLETGNVLIHCSVGKTRSPAVGIAFVMQYSTKHNTYDAAAAFVNENYPALKDKNGRVLTMTKQYQDALKHFKVAQNPSDKVFAMTCYVHSCPDACPCLALCQSEMCAVCSGGHEAGWEDT